MNTATKRITHLLSKRFDGSLTATEEVELQQYVNTHRQTVEDQLALLLHEQSKAAPTDEHDAAQMLRTLKTVLTTDRALPDKRSQSAASWAARNLRWVAASFVLAALLTAALFTYLNTSQALTSTMDDAGIPAASVPVDYIRTIVLPDSSLVVLQAGSYLSFPDGFGEDKREVSLTGEAYFHIRKVETGSVRKPFTIYSGKIKTTVLGTSFNIKAYPDDSDIVISVVTGKVQIEDQTKILAVLTEHQQISYSTEALAHVERVVERDKATAWTRADLTFASEPFDKIVEVLEKRFNVTIDFLTPSLKNCITIASFNETETLDNILDILCTIRGASYHFETPTHIVIDGEGCD